MATTSIEWTDSTWNPLTGCTKISPGCQHCYAERMARRLRAMGQPNYANGFRLTVHEHALEIPLRWKRPQNIFVNSMSDLFHRIDIRRVGPAPPKRSTRHPTRAVGPTISATGPLVIPGPRQSRARGVGGGSRILVGQASKVG